jgi:hypothetical protein
MTHIVDLRPVGNVGKVRGQVACLCLPAFVFNRITCRSQTDVQSGN